MTSEEIYQVQDYISKLTAEHASTLQALHVTYAGTIAKLTSDLTKEVDSQKKARTFALEERNKMAEAVLEIWKLSRTQTLTPVLYATYVRQIINHYCPDFDIPF